ncbi:hypothetical protein SEA_SMOKINGBUNNY_66 [Gordonia phage SmokingBunny]|uniref:Uncharacterized protein n=2 Tax=Wizardvirus TaxID=2169658 RepID=A0A515MHJ4_9CAUD|nr:hypothetical protein KNU53_gp66 [Gordonia phage SmokingBunny]YP_010103079.1 hypothetical protein KNU63_gp69 [Gordonia phage RogerDodger]QCG77877.1 hypothetical protein SEA_SMOKINGBUNNY_66 [Gordonia phage SmokingBunny]QDM56151.1 hypothetical protein SEA_ROGERDODGER_69 [Gordonia phage RogerDodger]WAA20283.1 hypothetical protein SEA_TOGO_65 [Gordonia phage Togo]
MSDFVSVLEARTDSVPFPEFTHERVYMRRFIPADGLPADLARWQPTVDAMLDGIDVDGVAFLMIDQGIVEAGNLHRRGGLHVDGHWIDGSHGTPAPSYPRHSAPPPRRHYAPAPIRHVPPMPDWHRNPAPRHDAPAPGHHSHHGGPREALLLATDVYACDAYVGGFDGPIGEGGDCSHVDVTPLDRVELRDGTCWAGNVALLHQSVPVPVTTARTLVRLNVPGWTPA